MSILTIANEADFEANVLNNESPVLVDFWASWCGPCKMLAPILDKIEMKFEGKIAFAKVNIDDCQELAQNYKVMSIPTLILFKGGKPIAQTVGVQQPATIEKMINDNL